MLRTKQNEVLATLYIPNIAYLRPHLFCCKFHSLKIKKYNKKMGLVECRKLSLCSKQVTLKEFSGSTWGTWLHWKLQWSRQN